MLVSNPTCLVSFESCVGFAKFFVVDFVLVVVEEVGVCTGPGRVVFFWVVVVRSGPQFVRMPPVDEFDFFERGGREWGCFLALEMEDQMDLLVRERGYRTLFLTEVVRHLEKIRRKNSNNFRRSPRHRNRNPNILVHSFKGKGFSKGSGSGYIQTGVCVLIGMGRGVCERMEGMNGRGRVGAGLCFGGRGTLLRNPPSFLSGVQFPLLILLPTRYFFS